MEMKKVQTFVFDGDKQAYPMWALQMTSMFALSDLAGVVDHVADDDDAEVGVRQPPAAAKNAEVFHKLCISLGPSCSHLVRKVPMGDGRALWDKIRSEYASPKRANIQSLLSAILSCPFKGNVSEYLLSMDRLLAQLKATGEDCAAAERSASLRVAQSLPDRFSVITSRVLLEENYSWDDFSGDLRVYLEAIGSSQATSSGASGLMAHGKQPSERGRGRNSGSVGKPFNGTCHFCGRQGHRRAQCKEALRILEQAKRDRGSAHLAAGSEPASEGSAFAFWASEEMQAIVPHDGPAPVSWCADSGASFHVCNDERLFTTIAPSSVRIDLANGDCVSSAGVGTVPLLVSSRDGMISIELRDVLLMPGAKYNLLSVSRLTAAGGSLVANKDGAILHLPGNRSLSLVSTSGLLWLHGSPAHDGRKPASAFATKTVSPLTLHRRLAHLNEDAMRAAGLLPAGKELPFCEPCVLGKSKRAAVSKSAAPRDLKPGQLTHTDLNGPMEVDSLSGRKYAIVFVDDASRFCSIYLMSAKSEALDCFKRYVGEMKQRGVVVGQGCILQSDNDSVYRNEAFDDYCLTNGISQRFSAPHTQAENGVAERMWNTVLDAARAMLADSGLGKEFWGAALVHAAYVRNRVPTSAKGGKVPLTLLTGKEPDLSKLRRFGCAAYVHTERSLRAKWDPKSSRGVFVGCGPRSKTWLVYMDDSKVVRESAHVTFDEGDDAVEEEKVAERVAPASSPSSVTVELVQQQQQQQPPVVPQQDEEEEEEVDPLLMDYSSDDASHDALLALIGHVSPSDPATIRDAMESAQADQWMAALQEEYAALQDNETWAIVPARSMPAGTRPLKSKVVFKTKYAPDGSVDRFKCRLVVKGCAQRKGIDYDEVFAPVAHHTTIRVLLSTAAARSIPVHQMDVKTAFLNPKLEEELYMEVPEGLSAPKGSVCKLLKSLYGLRQAPRYWNQELDRWMASAGLSRSGTDPCLYVQHLDSGCYLYVTVWVDDLLIASEDGAAVDAFKAAISKRFKMSDLGLAHHCLGMRIVQDPAKAMVSIDQEQYVKELLAKQGMADCRAVSTPLPVRAELTAGAIDDGDLQLDEDCAHRFREITGSLLYLVACTRPDLAVATNQLSRCMKAPFQSHLTAAKHVLRYLKGCSSLGLCYHGPPSDLHGFADATWGSKQPKPYSVGGYVFRLNGAAVSWKTKKQTRIALSSAEAEYMSLCEATRECIYLRHLLRDMGIAPTGPTEMFEDNQPCIHIANNPVTSSRTKHVDLSYHFIRESIQDGAIKVVYCPTTEMIADEMTKILARPQHEKLRALIMGEGNNE